MPEKGGGGAASPVRWPPLAVIRGDSDCLNRFSADIMGSYTHYPLMLKNVPMTPPATPRTLPSIPPIIPTFMALSQPYFGRCMRLSGDFYKLSQSGLARRESFTFLV